ncbi:MULTISPECIES: peptidoglycan-binding protein [unclassified Aeromicrobium]|uniref:peptidoglycan-binding protein n=1 Tax=unclassified Aeromicrobium TaxID=2633570 RepID=UPI00288AE3A9|nr:MULTISPECIES: peptidoglycan-binding protein [unclassified Aeromicrobium]
MVTYLPRSAWTPTSNGRAGRALSVSKVDRMVDHYPADGNVVYANLTQAQVAAKLRAYRQAHLNRGWADIGYNYAIDQKGRIWFLTGDNIGAHANVTGNTKGIGVLFVVGNNEPISQAAIEAFRALRADKRKKFTKATLVQGHQQVPGNSTSCPGQPLMALNRSGALAQAPGGGIVGPPDRMAAASYPPVGPSAGEHITWLGERLVLHLKAAGIKVPYAVGPGPGWSDTDREAVRLFQEGQGWTGDDADGYPGPVTLQRLADSPAKWPAVTAPTPVPDPVEEVETHYTVLEGDTLYSIAGRLEGVEVDDLVRWNGLSDADVIHVGQQLSIVEPEVIPPVCPVPEPVEPDPVPPKDIEWVDESILFWNLAGYNAARGKATALKRVPAICAYANKVAPDVLVFVEASHAMLAALDKGLPKYQRALRDGRDANDANGAGREVYVRRDALVIKDVSFGNVTTMLNGDDKPMLGVVYGPKGGGTPRAVVAAHNENQDGIDKKTRLDADIIRRRQIRENLVFLVHKVAAPHKVPLSNQALGVDGNSYEWALDEAERMNWRSSFDLAASTKNAQYATHTNWRDELVEAGHFDLVLLRHDAKVVSASQELDPDTSDHNPILVVRKVRA